MSSSFGDMSNTFMNVNTPTIDPSTQPNNINVDPNQAVDPIQENLNEFIYGNDAKKKGKQVTIKGKMKTRVTDGEALANTAIAGIRGIAGLKNRFNTRDNYADYQDEMTRPEALYANTVKTYKGEEADIAGKQLGLKRFDEMGQMDYTGTNTAKYGRFMQEGGESEPWWLSGEIPEEVSKTFDQQPSIRKYSPWDGNVDRSPLRYSDNLQLSSPYEQIDSNEVVYPSQFRGARSSRATMPAPPRLQEGGLIDSLLEDEEYELPEELIEYLIALGS